MPTIGTLTIASSTTTLVIRFLLGSMKEFGWEENRNYRVLYRWAEGRIERIPVLTGELVAQ
jgi:hypothetical protein